MLRKSVPVVVLALLVAAFSFAEGQPERQPVPPGATGDKVTVTGKVYLQNKLHPELASGSQQYLLLVPRRLTWNLDVKEGEQVTVEGYKVPAPRVGSVANATYLQVTKATIKGKEYNLSDYFAYGRGADRWGDRRGSMMGGRGGQGRGFGPGAGGYGYGPGGCPDCDWD